jgi:hypothetical protein
MIEAIDNQEVKISENTFHIGEILTIITNILLSIYKEQGVFDLLAYMVDEPIYEFQVPRLMQECKPALLAQFPEFEGLEELLVGKVTEENWLLVLNELVDEFGGFREVEKIDPSLHQKLDPRQEALEIAEKCGFDSELEEFIAEENAKGLV